MNIKYVVVKEKKLVKAIGTCPTKYADGISNDLGDFLVSRGVSPSTLTISHSMTAVARCSDLDEFDESVGKQIARDRLLQKYNKHVVAVHKLAADKLKDVISDCDWHADVSKRKMRNADNRLKETAV